MERNKVKIICNPFEKKIEYRRWGIPEGEEDYEWMELGSKSKLLIEKKFTHATIQHNAFEIIDEICVEYNRGNVGLDIVFEGTSLDYNDFCDIINQYYKDSDVHVVLGDLYIETAEAIMPKIQDIFREMVQLFGENNSSEMETLLKKYFDATQTIIPICVMGMYSTGKSAFINALIGEEILPSAITPTTARNYRIVESEKTGIIRFTNSGEKVRIIFENEKFKFDGNIDRELKDSICEKIKSEEGRNLSNNIYYSLTVINNYANKNETISDLIEVEVPFNKSVFKNEGYKFVIFDTPGSDSESHEEHLEVLMKALEGQTNGLPILLTSPDNLDRKDAKNLLKVVNGIDGSLDLTNAMIIVNKADTLSDESLEAIKSQADTIMTQWKSNRLYFLSSIIGLGSKKKDNNKWLDKNYKKMFSILKDSFCNENDDMYMQLFLHNDIAENRKDAYADLVKGKKDERELLYINSGLDCIEREIVEFAKKYALFNKCAQAQDYLEEAILLTSRSLEEKKDESSEIRKKLVAQHNAKKKELLELISAKIAELSKKYVSEYPNYMLEYVQNEVKAGDVQVEQIVSNDWELVKSNDRKQRVNDFRRKSKVHFEEEQKKHIDIILKKSNEYWKGKQKSIQDFCIKIVKENESLSNEEKKYLESFIEDFDFKLGTLSDVNYSVEDISRYFVHIFGLKAGRLNIINQGQTKKLYKSVFDQNMIWVNNRINALHRNEFRSYSEKFEMGLENRVASLNPELRELTEMLKCKQKEIDDLQKQQEIISENQLKIQGMFEFKVVEER